ncbi:MAG: phosphatase PAP2 family protein [Pyrinomonadaceae bacterium]
MGLSESVPRLFCRDRLRLVFLLLFLAVSVQFSFAQGGKPEASPSPSPSPRPLGSPRPSLERHFFTNILKDQYGIWTAPFHIRRGDMKWLLPIGGVSAAFFASDEQTAHLIGNNSTQLKISRDLSQLGEGYSVGGAAISIYLIGRTTHNARTRETGLLALEAFIDSSIVTEVFKGVTQRPRPTQRDGEGKFFTDGSSFISGHSSSIWSLAAVINDEYGKRHPLVRYGIFGLATAVSLSRYTGRNHFLSDILVGSAVGYGVGHFVYRRHHDPSLDEPGVPIKPTTKLEKYFPRIEPEFNGHKRIFGAQVAWNF